MDVVRLRLHRPQWQLLVVSLIIAICLVAMGVALAISVTGRAAEHLPAAIEQIDPVPAAVRVPAQTSVFVDLQAGYTGIFIVDGLELKTVNIENLQDKNKPGQQINLPPTTIYEPGNATLTFKPVPGAPIKEFTQGQHVVKLVYWKVIEGQNTASEFTWTFNVF
jgi:hypothetical protein